MIDTDNVLLLRPVDPPSGFDDLPTTRPGVQATPPSSIVVGTIYSIHANAEATFPAFFRKTIHPALQAAEIRVRATFQTEHSPNNYPALPVREGEHVFVWFASYESAAAYADSVTRLSQSSGWKKANDALVAYLDVPPQQLHLRPTGRSLLK